MVLLPTSFFVRVCLPSLDSDGGELEKLWQVEEGAEEGDGESVGADVPPLSPARVSLGHDCQI